MLTQRYVDSPEARTKAGAHGLYFCRKGTERWFEFRAGTKRTRLGNANRATGRKCLTLEQAQELAQARAVEH
ncbi:MAG: hypothetical protein OXC11_06150, partial [Rhodospirillales bacterium]|nr:hypothetical protein [Rhodospirillales bacterium]